MSRFFLLVFGFFCSLQAHAAIFEVSFSGTVTQIEGSGAGYSVGAPIDGSLTINSDRAGDYGSWENGYGFITSRFARPTVDAKSGDTVYIINDEDGGSLQRDHIYLSDFEYNGTTDENGGFSYNYTGGVEFWVGSYQTDFLSDSSLFQNFDLDLSEAAYMYGSIFFYDYLEFNSQSGRANFNLDNISYRQISSVPLPPSLLLFGLGLITVCRFPSKK